MTWRFLGFLFIVGAVVASPVGNPATPALIREGIWSSERESSSIRIGYEGDFVADARLGQFDQGQGRVDCYKQMGNSALLTVDLCGRCDLYAALGASVVEADWRFSDPATQAASRVCMHTNQPFSWGLGGRAIYYEWRHLFFGVGGRYSSCRYGLDSFTSNGEAQSTQGASLLWQEWQVNLDLAYQISWMIPYVGAKYSHARAYLQDFSSPIATNLSGNNSFKNRNPVGFYLGCSLSNGHYFLINIEGRLVDEEAVSVEAEFRF